MRYAKFAKKASEKYTYPSTFCPLYLIFTRFRGILEKLGSENWKVRCPKDTPH
jgi:hypothetical protein